MRRLQLSGQSVRGTGIAWRLPLAITGGLALWAAFPRLAWRPLAVVGVALLFVAVRGTRARTGALLGLGFGLAFFVPLLSWLQIGAGTNAWLILAAVQALYLAALGAGLAVVTRLPAWPLWAAALWVAAEAVRGRTPLGGFTWGRLGYSQDEGPLLPWTSVGGPALVTFLVALVAALVVAVPAQLRRRPALFSAPPRRLRTFALLALAAAPFVASPLLPAAPGPDRTETVALVQGNVPRLGLAAFEQRRQVLRNHVEATARLAERIEAGVVPRPAAVLWPENSTDIDPRTDDEVRGLIEQAAERVGVPLLVGAVLDRADGRVENAGVVWDPQDGPGDVYVKRHLVPYGEYVPLRDLLTPVFGRLALIPRDFVPGTADAVLPLGGMRVGDVICFEVSYDGLVRDAVRNGAEVLVVQTNNATYGRSALTDQQLAMSKLRAVEHGRAVLVVATSGISAVVAPDGSIVGRTAIWEQDVLVHRVPLSTGRTAATRLGAAPEWALAGIGVVALVVGVLVARVR